MKTIDCPNLCPECPIRGLVVGEPAAMGEVAFQAPGTISDNGRSASIELHNGMPIGERFSTIAVANGVGDIVMKFPARGSDWDNGNVERAFEECDAPTQKRGGFLHLQRKLACTAIESLNS